MSQPPGKHNFPFSPPGSGEARNPADETSPNFIPPPPLQPVEEIAIQGPGPGSRRPDRASLSGGTIGPYRIVRELARGGMGSVYLCKDEGLNRQVAVKVMSRDLLADRDALARFQREARATASILHRNIAMVYLVGTAADGSPFIAMEYIPGGSLEGMIVERTPVPFSRVADLMIQCCEGLGAACRKSIIHRDIKPGNIMLDADGTVKIVDFGLAKVFLEDSYRTVAGMVMGTPRYMAPEQSQGREVDYRADMYSLGATFYHLVVGKPPFDGPNPTQIMMKHVTAPLVPARKINPEVPIEFDDVLRRCMAKEPSARYPDYSGLVADLGKIKLQYIAKERGSIVTGMGDMPTMRVGPGGMPLSPGTPARRGDRSIIGRVLAAGSAEESVVPIWRYFAMGAGVLIALVAIVLALLFSAKPTTGPAGQAGRGEAMTGLGFLVNRLSAEARSEAPTAPPPDSDYLAYLATREIVEELGRAMFTFSVEKGRQADSIVELARSGAAVQIYDTSPRGVPLDGWGRPLDYARGQQVIASMGFDGRPSTADDIRCDAEGTLSIANNATYDALEERERTRIARR